MKKEDKKEEVLDEKDALDWIIISGVITEKQLSKKFKVKKKRIREIVNKLEKDGILKRQKKLLSSPVQLNEDTEQGMNEKGRLLPSVDIVEKKKIFKTNLDILKTLIDRFGKIELQLAAKFFKTRKETVEEWAKILHSQGLITLFYPITGETILLKRGRKQGLVNSTLIKYIIIVLLILIAIYKREQVMEILDEVLKELYNMLQNGRGT